MVEASRGDVRVSADFRLNLEGVRMRNTNFSFTNLKEANFRNADCRYVDFTGADFADAILEGTDLRGAILAEVDNLTWAQLDQAIIDETTVLPDYLVAAKSGSSPRRDLRSDSDKAGFSGLRGYGSSIADSLRT